MRVELFFGIMINDLVILACNITVIDIDLTFVRSIPSVFSSISSLLKQRHVLQADHNLIQSIKSLDERQQV